jgi:hypothetical protein
MSQRHLYRSHHLSEWKGKIRNRSESCDSDRFFFDGIRLLESVFLEILYVSVYLVELTRDVDALRTV